jgi:hypothetical protein
MNTKQQILGILVLILSLALSGCGQGQLSGSTITPTATIMSTFTPTQTFTPTLRPTPTNTFTPTPDPIIVNAHAFMDPILESIKDRDSDYQDDFSNPYSGWPVGRQPYPGQGHEEGVLGYENGEYFVQADKAKFPWEGDPNKNITCLSAFHSPDVMVLDFVMEVDARLVTLSKNGDWQMKFWKEGPYYYGIRMDQWERAHFHTDFPLREFIDSNDCVETDQIPFFNNKGGVNHLVVVAKASQIAMTLNNHVVVYIDSLPPHERGRIAFVVCNFGGVPFRAQWDNLKIWDLSE